MLAVSGTVSASIITTAGAVVVAMIGGAFAMVGARRNDSTDDQLLDALTALAECEAREHARADRHRR